jgi:hypothetical protein
MKKTLLFALLTTFSMNAQTVTDYVTGLGKPTGIVFDGSGNLYVADNNAYKITKITPALVQSTFVSSLNGTPQQITFDNNNNLWTAGSGFINSIEKISSSGTLTSYSATNSPYGIAIDATGDVYYSQETGNIMKRTVAGVTTTFATGISQPNGMTFDKSGNLIVVDKVEGEIKKITPAGVVSTIITGLANPTNVAYAPNGDLYISTGSQGRIFVLPAGGVDGDEYQYIRFFGEQANHIAIYNGALYVSKESKIVKIADTVFLGLGDLNTVNSEVLIYPNPTSDFVSINNLNPVTKSIQLFDLSGKLVKNYNTSDIKNNTLSLSGLVSGNYIIKIDNFSKKIIIK